MTFKTSAVAVCCCSASERSRVRACTSSNSRTLLDGDHGLVGECLEERDLLVGEGLRLGAADHDRPDAFALTHQRNGQNGAVAHLQGEVPSVRELLAFERQIAHMDRLAIDDGAPADPTATDRPFFERDGDRAAMGAEAHRVAVPENDGRVIGHADFAGAVDDRPQDR